MNNTEDSIPMLSYESLIETLDLMNDPEALENLRIAREDIANGRIMTKDATGKFVPAIHPVAK